MRFHPCISRSTASDVEDAALVQVARRHHHPRRSTPGHRIDRRRAQVAPRDQILDPVRILAGIGIKMVQRFAHLEQVFPEHGFLRTVEACRS